MRVRRRKREGQALIMVTLALMAMFGLMGLLVDFGYAFFLEKMMQNAADAAALAAVRAALDGGGGPTSFTCGSTAVCAPAPLSCASATANLQVGCQYALRNGFDWRQPNTSVTVQASDRNTPPTVVGCTPLTHHPPTAPCVDTYYWVTVRIARNVPQLFSAIWGNGMGLVSARATAAIAQSTTIGNLILTNRENDPNWDPKDTGTNLKGGGGGGAGSANFFVPGGITMASGHPQVAGNLSGNSSVQAGFTWIRASGWYTLGGAQSTWVAQPRNQAGDPNIPSDNDPYNSPFVDPFYGDGQPPLPDASVLGSLPLIAVPGGTLTTTICPNGVCGPGIYYATDVPCRGCAPAPSGQPIGIWQGNFRFQWTGNFDTSTFVFFGGLRIGQARVDFGPGRYVLAGVNPAYGNLVFETTNQSFVTGGSTSPNSRDAGRIFILTDERYAGDQLLPARSRIPGLPDLAFGTTKVIAGNNASSSITLQGLNRLDQSLPTAMHPYSPVLFWQDQRNSNYRYDDQGRYFCAANINAACPQDLSDGRGNPNPEFWMQATQFLSIWGAIYQPRGAWMTLVGGNLQTGPIQVVTGAVWLQGGSDLALTGLETPIVNFVASLVE
jgi:hypothetical protein